MDLESFATNFPLQLRASLKASGIPAMFCCWALGIALVGSVGKESSSALIALYALVVGGVIVLLPIAALLIWAAAFKAALQHAQETQRDSNNDQTKYGQPRAGTVDAPQHSNGNGQND